MHRLLVAIAVIGAAGCADREQPLELRGATMGTTYSVSVLAPSGQTRVLHDEVQAILADFDAHLSTYRADSELARFNAAPAGQWLPVSPLLHATVQAAQAVSEETSGAFDITVAPLVRLWRGAAAAAPDVPYGPGDLQIAQARARVGYSLLESRPQPPALRKAVAGLELDVDAIAPGLAVDRIAERFEALGVERYLVELGGEVRAGAARGAGRAWRVAVEAPLSGVRRPYAMLALERMAVSTSGDYRTPRDAQGQRIAGSIDPRSGNPVSHGLASVTVLDGSAARADARATALMVLGPEAGYAWAEQRAVPALFLTRNDDDSISERQTTAFTQYRRAMIR